MKVRVLLFSQMRIRAGSGEIELDLPQGSRLAEAVEVLLSARPELRPFTRSCMTAVGLDYAPADRVLSDGDEISLIPPVSGG